jgi:antibiotic biosynthesis monooxygenase (ABM) superfamily enzyme
MSDNQPVGRRHFLALVIVASGTAVDAQTPVVSTDTVTLLFSMTVKPDRLQDFATVAQKLTRTTVFVGTRPALGSPGFFRDDAYRALPTSSLVDMTCFRFATSYQLPAS